MKYLTKPTTVEAFRVTSIDVTSDLPDWAKVLLDKNVIYLDYIHDCLQIGPLSAYIGDYVLLDKQGNLHVCEDRLFHLIFRVEED